MKLFLGLFFMCLAGAVFYAKGPVTYYTTPKQLRLSQLWDKDIQQLSQDQQFQEIFADLANIELHFTDPQVAEEFENLKAPFQTNAAGQRTLKVSITRWIEERDYGFIVQHELFSLDGNKVYEFGRTYKVGIIL